MNQSFHEALMKSGYIHAPLSLPKEGSLESALAEKPVLESRSLWDGESADNWQHKGSGFIAPKRDVSAGKGILRLSAPIRTEQWPAGASPDGDYTNYGSAQAVFTVTDGDWRGFNRLVFRVRPDCPGLHAPVLNIGLTNEGDVPIPDPYFRDGFHVCNLVNREWNLCIWEFPDLPRDRITTLTFSAYLNGRDVNSRLPAGRDDLTYDFADLAVQRIAEPEPAHGWEVPDGRVSLAVPGYWRDGRKTALLGTSVDSFRLVDAADGAVVFEGPVKQLKNGQGSFHEADFSTFQRQGLYRLEAGELRSHTFTIAENPLHEAVWKVINFLYCERCGHPVSGKHGACHSDLTAEHDGLRMTYAGGWHDAGDVSQQTAQTAEITQALFETAMRLPSTDPLHVRLMEEAEWGLDFILRTRFGDGFRASSAGVTRWSDGLTGNMDDVPVRVHNQAFLNYLCAGVEAQAAIALAERDPELARHCLQVAEADFAFAEVRYAEMGIELPSFFEHTYSSGPSAYAALVSWAASLLFEAGAVDLYADRAREEAAKLLVCQETDGVGMTEGGAPFRGFFYRDAGKQAIVHYNHQSREQLPMQSLERLCATQSLHPDRPRWEKAMRLYAEYLRNLVPFTAPFDMLPAGLHRADEAEDAETFRLLHLLVDPAKEQDNHREQLDAAAHVGNAPDSVALRVRRFPVWFSFRGNLAVHLAQGKAASILGRCLKAPDLTELARGQLYWLHGKNPFCQSLMYGEGTNFAQQYAVLPGEMVGEMPVGIQTRGNEDEPFWPQANNATYKEVWTSTATHWLRIMADLI